MIVSYTSFNISYAYHYAVPYPYFHLTKFIQESVVIENEYQDEMQKYVY